MAEKTKTPICFTDWSFFVGWIMGFEPMISFSITGGAVFNAFSALKMRSFLYPVKVRGFPGSEQFRFCAMKRIKCSIIADKSAREWGKIAAFYPILGKKVFSTAI